MAWATTAVYVMAGAGALSAYSGASAANRAAGRAEDEAKRRYALEASSGLNQMEEQNSIAMQQMTDIGRAYLKAKGEMAAVQANSGVSGNVAQRLSGVTRTKFSEAKGKVANEATTNIVNIAQGLLANKIDAEAMIAEANSKRKNVFTSTLMGAVSGAQQGYSMGKSMGLGGKPPVPPVPGAAGAASSSSYINAVDWQNMPTEKLSGYNVWETAPKMSSYLGDYNERFKNDNAISNLNYGGVDY